MSDKVLFSERLKCLREETGLSQGELAKRLDASRGSISFYENGSRAPDIHVLKKMCLLFGVTADYLIGLTDYRNEAAKEEIERDVQTQEKLLALLPQKSAASLTNAFELLLRKLVIFYRRSKPEDSTYNDVVSHITGVCNSVGVQLHFCSLAHNSEHLSSSIDNEKADGAVLYIYKVIRTHYLGSANDIDRIYESLNKWLDNSIKEPLPDIDFKYIRQKYDMSILSEVFGTQVESEDKVLRNL